MAAGSLSEAFTFIPKRKRHIDDDNDATNDFSLFRAKRPNLTQLPIRSPPRPVIAVTPAFGQYGLPSGTLTPDSIPENTAFSTQDQISSVSKPTSPNQTPHRQALHIDVESSNHASTSMDLDMGSPKQSRPPPTPIRIGRARSNDLMSPMSPMHSPGTGSLLSPPSFARDRLPTPVASSFPGGSPFEKSFASAASRQLRPHFLQQSTSLSPMVDAESWTPQIRRPPSPEPELDDPFDEDASMAGVEDSNMMSDSFTNLSVHSQDNMNDLPDLRSSPTRHVYSWSPRTRGLGLDSSSSRGPMRPDGLRMSTINDTQAMIDQQHSVHHNRSQSTGRVAKLHMGFKADCEKCIARVPGHYSHIIWSEAVA